MSSMPGMTRELLAFDGPVQCQALNGAVQLQLWGRRCGTGEIAELLLERLVASPALPSPLHEVRVAVLAESGASAAAPTVLRIDSREGSFEVRAAAVQVHQAAGAAFFRAVPPARVPWTMRLLWSVLLGVLRVPGVVRLVRSRRG